MSEYNQDIEYDTSNFELHPEGHFVMQFSSFKPVMHEEWGQMLELHFTSPELREADDKPFELRRRVSAKISKKSHLYSFLCALGADVQEEAEEYMAVGGGRPFPLSSFLGRRVGVTIKHEAKAAGTVYANIKDFVRHSTKKRATAAATADSD